MSLKNNPRIGHSPSTVDEALSWLNRMAHGEPEMHLVSLRAAVDLVRRELFTTRINRDEWRRHAEERLREVLLLRSAAREAAEGISGVIYNIEVGEIQEAVRQSYEIREKLSASDAPATEEEL